MYNTYMHCTCDIRYVTYMYVYTSIDKAKRKSNAKLCGNLFGNLFKFFLLLLLLLLLFYSIYICIFFVVSLDIKVMYFNMYSS